jgi:hypothetical protein
VREKAVPLDDGTALLLQTIGALVAAVVVSERAVTKQGDATGAGTIQVAYVVLHAALAAVRSGRMVSNPGDGSPKPNVARNSVTIWTKEQAQSSLTRRMEQTIMRCFSWRSPRGWEGELGRSHRGPQRSYAS